MDVVVNSELSVGSPAGFARYQSTLNKGTTKRIYTAASIRWNAFGAKCWTGSANALWYMQSNMLDFFTQTKFIHETCNFGKNWLKFVSTPPSKPYHACTAHLNGLWHDACTTSFILDTEQGSTVTIGAIMSVPFLDLKANFKPLRDEILREITDVLDNTAYVLGPKVQRFETAFAEMHQTQFCYAVSSGTDANHLALWALGIGQGDEVIIPANTFIATAWGATLCGATPVFVDCDPRTYTIDASKVEAAITPRTKAVVAVHLYGQAADMDALRAICTKHNVYLVEDAAQSHNALYNGKPIGGLGDMCSFSFYPGKNLGAYGEGGAVTTNNPEWARKVRMIRDHGSEKKYYHEMYGHNYRMEAIQGAVLGVKLPHLQDYTEKRRAVAARYLELLKDCSEIVLPYERPGSRHVYHLFVIQTPERDALQKYLQDHEIGTGLHYPVPLHLQQCFSHLGYKQGQFPVSEQLGNQCLSLPMFPEMTDEQIVYVCDHVKSYFATASVKSSATAMA